ncbi:MAG TPA: ABC transporter permease [Tepidisphaeraceae bacterium]|nr:ABC transporter permease [Tepidisphaeraceae bacterium]
MNKTRFTRLLLPPLIPLAAITLLAEVAVRCGWVHSFLIPAPTNVIASIFRDWQDLGRAIVETGFASITGFAFSTIIGIAIAVTLSSSVWMQRAFYPYAVFFQTVPIIAVAPLLVIWVGWNWTVATSAFIVSIFPVIANTLTGLLSTDPALRDLFKLYGANAPATLLKLRLPFALPNILTGLRIAAGLAVIGAIVGEFITGAGIGGVIQVSSQQQRVDKVFAGLLLASLLGIGLFTLINLISRMALRNWHASESAT